MWKLSPTTGYLNDRKHYDKKHPNELAAVLNNLSRYLELLGNAKNASIVEAGYLHPEPGGIKAIDQRGRAPNLQQTRLYTYADDQTKIVYLLAIGDKKSQPSDIEYCKGFPRTLREARE